MDKYRTFRRYRHGAGLLSGYHETREAIIPLADNETWDKAIAGMLYLLKEI